jgi:hypothetical protein
MAHECRGARHRPLDSRIKGRKVRRGRSCDSAEAYPNFSSMTAPCKNLSSLLRSIGQRNVLTALIPTWLCRAVEPGKASPAPAFDGRALMAQRERYAAPRVTGTAWRWTNLRRSQDVCQDSPQANADRCRRLPPRSPPRARPTHRSRSERAAHHGIERRTSAYARRRFKRKNGRFWRAQF